MHAVQLQKSTGAGHDSNPAVLGTDALNRGWRCLTSSVCCAEAKAAAADADEIQLSLIQKAKALAGALQPAYWQALIVVSLLYFARFDASFITLRARTVRQFFLDALMLMDWNIQGIILLDS